MPEWITVGNRVLYNIDHVAEIHKMADGTAELVLVTGRRRVQTDVPYDEICEWIESRSQWGR